MSDSIDSSEKKFRDVHGDDLTERILLHTSQMYDYPFWLREQSACYDDPEIAYEVALCESGMPTEDPVLPAGETERSGP